MKTPKCPASSKHSWTRAFEGGLKENPGVWSTGGTTLVSSARCRHCGMRRTETKYGAQRNPGQRDKIDYSDPDPAWVAHHFEE